MIATLLLLWVVCAGVAAFIASIKGRSVGTFAIAGLLLGPVGVIWAACVKTADQLRAEQAATMRQRDAAAAAKPWMTGDGL